MASTPAATPSNFKFRLFSLSRSRLPTSKKEKSPPVMIIASQPHLWQTDGDDSESQGFHTGASVLSIKEYTSMPRSRTALATLTQSPPLGQPSTPHREGEPSTRLRHDMRTLTPERYTEGAQKPHFANFEHNVCFEAECSERSYTTENHEHITKKRGQGYLGGESAPLSGPATAPYGCQHERLAYPNSNVPLTASYHACEAGLLHPSPTDANKVDLEEYPWYICRNIEGRDVRRDLNSTTPRWETDRRK